MSQGHFSQQPLDTQIAQRRLDFISYYAHTTRAHLFADDVEVDVAVLAGLGGRDAGVGQPRRHVLRIQFISFVKGRKWNKKLTESRRRQFLRNVDMACAGDSAAAAAADDPSTRSATAWRSEFDPNDAA